MSRIIASRTLTERGSSKTITLNLREPRRDGKDWVCEFEFRGRRDMSSHAYGSDALQALSLAFLAIRIQLDKSKRKYFWLGALPAELGFPRLAAGAFGLTFMERIEKLVDRETALLCATIKREWQAGHFPPLGKRPYDILAYLQSRRKRRRK